MSNFSHIFKQCILAVIFVTLFFPLVQNKFNFVITEPLKGDVSVPSDASLGKKAWFSGEYQEQQEAYINSTFGLRNLCVRLNNQIAFSFFKKPSAKGVVIGKNDYLYEENYLLAFSGRDFLGTDSINKIVKRIKFISDTLNKLNKQLIIVFAAGKASFYPEYIPDNYLPAGQNTNYKALSAGIKNANVNHIDFNSWFMAQKSIAKYPLYPQYGIHWSVYGSVLAADSIIKQIEYLRKTDLPNLIYKDIDVKPAQSSDVDIAEGMNLLQTLKTFDMAYPKISTEKDTSKTKPVVLVVSDSFYWVMYSFGIANSFKSNHFWYYNKQVYPETFNGEVLAENLDFSEQINNHDVFIVMATEATLPKLSWGFLENAERFFKYGKVSEKADLAYKNNLAKIKLSIKENGEWMEQIKNKALERNISIDSMLTLDAIWKLNN